MDVYERIKELGITLPPPPKPGGIYFQTKEFGNSLCYVSGTGPEIPGGKIFNGKVGAEYTLEEGRDAARCTALNVLSVLHNNIGDLNKVKSIAKLLCYVACADDFYRQPEVANGASQLLIDVFGESIGKATRSAIGVYALPGNIPFEMEVLIELK